MKTLKELSKGVFGPKKIRWKEKKLRKFFFPLFGVQKKRRKKNMIENWMESSGK